jgi:hypothetical protein
MTTKSVQQEYDFFSLELAKAVREMINPYKDKGLECYREKWTYDEALQAVLKVMEGKE